MDSRVINIFILVPLTLALIFLGDINKSMAQNRLRHPGRVVEMDTGDPVTVDIKAWPKSSQTGRSGDCPLYGSSALDSTESKTIDYGRFELNVDESYPTYTTTYCAENYYPRADRDLSNRTYGSRVLPYPTKVLKRTVSKETINRLITSKTLVLLNDLAYLQSVHPDNFHTVMRTLARDIGESSPSRGELLQGFADFIYQWRR